MHADSINLRGARANNLRGVDVQIPIGKLTVVTGLSGSGKSSLAFDTLYAEGQRRYAETFSPYTRQFLERVDKPAIDHISAIPPAIALSQGNAIRTSRSTVGTMTELADAAKQLFARLGRCTCPACARPLRPWSAGEIAEQLVRDWSDAEALLVFAVPFPPKTPLSDAAAFLQAQGFLRVWWDGAPARLEELTAREDAPKHAPPELIVVQDRVRIASENAAQRRRLQDSLEAALASGKGVVRVLRIGEKNGKASMANSDVEQRFASRWICPWDGTEVRPPSPALFSFNHPLGACPTCRGFGRTVTIDDDRVIPDRSKTLAEGAVQAWRGAVYQESQADLARACRREGVPMNVPFEKLSAQHQKFVLEGELEKFGTWEKLWRGKGWYGVRGFFVWLESRAYKMHVRVFLSRFRSYRECPDCGGTRFCAEARQWRVPVTGAEVGLTLGEWNALPLEELQRAARGLVFSAEDEPTRRLQEQILVRVGYLIDVGLGYLTLGRAARTLSGGEVQRVNLTACLGNDLANTLFVLDEPTVGLHPRDTQRLVGAICALRDRGNTVVVVEHDSAVLRAADWVVDLGPGRGERGGQVVFSGPIEKIGSAKESLTADYWTGRAKIPIPAKRRKLDPRRTLQLEDARAHNIRGLDVTIPLGAWVSITGVSGSGKSTLVDELLYPALRRALHLPVDERGAGQVAAVRGVGGLSDIIRVDQAPLVKNSRSNPALHLGVYEAIRTLFGTSEEARLRSLSPSDFSFNAGTGRCDRCQGSGVERIGMQFLADVLVTCPVCAGRRFTPPVLEVRWRGKSIDQVLGMTIAEAVDFFEPDPAEDKMEQRRCAQIIGALSLAARLGVEYLRLGQPLIQLSGGEAQRLKLLRYLVQAKKLDSVAGIGHSALFLLDEPSVGLHLEDVRLLAQVLRELVEAGHSLIVIEHQLDLIAQSDWVIDLGPEAGAGGGRIVAQGTPEKIAACAQSHTGQFLAEHFADASGRRRAKKADAKKSKAAASQTLRKATPPLISIRGARHHNLKNLDLDIKLGDMTVLTGLSGSGKSTLAFDLLFAEGQRRYLDSLGTYARQFVEQLEKPEVDSIRGIPPAVAIEQRTSRGGHKSTVASTTELHPFLRLLYAKLGQFFDPQTGEAAVHLEPEEVTTRALARAERGRWRVVASLVRGRKGFHTDVARWATRRGIERLRVDGKWIETKKFKALARFREHTIEAELGLLESKQSPATRRALIAQALEVGRGAFLLIGEEKSAASEVLFSTALYCPESSRAFEDPDPRLFSFNSRHGWCPRCEGFGVLPADASEPGADKETGEGDDAIPTAFLLEEKASGEESAGDLEAARERRQESMLRDGEEGAALLLCPACHGERLNADARAVRLPIGKSAWTADARGPRLPELLALSVEQARRLFEKVRFAGRAAAVARDILPEVRQRLEFLEKVGLGYLGLERATATLSGGEAQRIRLAAQLGSNLQGVLYVLDEPTIGLHPSDNERLLEMLGALKDRGNTLIVVEHDEETMRAADRILDLGPGAGERGGQIVADGTWRELAKASGPSRKLLRSKVLREGGVVLKSTSAEPAAAFSPTQHILGSRMAHPMRGTRRPVRPADPHWMLRGLHANNLKDLTLALPVGRLIGICGVSGSGKSTLLHQSLLPAARQIVAKDAPGRGKIRQVAASKGKAVPLFSGVFVIDQAPIGKTSRSTPSTYIGLMDGLRALFAQATLAKQLGYTASRFSFNAGPGRCPVCLGQGAVTLEMNFLPPVSVPCEVCNGLRYNPATLEVQWRGKNIAEVLGMTVEEALEFFSGVAMLAQPLQLLHDVGLGYLRLGQPSPTLSGGEAQRIKLVRELGKAGARQLRGMLREIGTSAARALYLLEEPTIGLHRTDVERLLEVLHRLVDAGHTVVVIEHHLDVLAEADWLIELGPGPGEAGGRLVASGTPEQVAGAVRSPTARFLQGVLKTEVVGKQKKSVDAPLSAR